MKDEPGAVKGSKSADLQATILKPIEADICVMKFPNRQAEYNLESNQPFIERSRYSR
jgi:hypothetical protein